MYCGNVLYLVYLFPAVDTQPFIDSFLYLGAKTLLYQFVVKLVGVSSVGHEYVYQVIVRITPCHDAGKAGV